MILQQGNKRKSIKSSKKVFVPELDNFHEEDGWGEDENVMEKLEEGAEAKTHAERAHQRHENREGVTRRAHAARRLYFDGVAPRAKAGLGCVALLQMSGAQQRLPRRVECSGDGGAAVLRAQVPQVI